jgi:hypothetical protein
MGVEGYRPAFDGDTEPADAETANVERLKAAPLNTAPAEAPQMPAPGPVTGFDPACLPLSEPYSLDGITAIPADVFRRSKTPR